MPRRGLRALVILLILASTYLVPWRTPPRDAASRAGPAGDALATLHGTTPRPPDGSWNILDAAVRTHLSPVIKGTLTWLRQFGYRRPLRHRPERAASDVLILVAGRLERVDAGQEHIDAAAAKTYRVFRSRGYGDERIYYMATNPSLPGVDAWTSEDSLERAIVRWAAERLPPHGTVTLFLIGHGNEERFNLDKPNGHWVRPSQLDAWLSALQAARPGVRVNVVIEACHSGSFIETPWSISGRDRIVIASTNASLPAHTSPTGTLFVDHLLTAMTSGQDLHSSFEAARNAVMRIHADQIPLLDDNGNGYWDASDGYLALQWRLLH
jgi:hypothetical protein